MAKAEGLRPIASAARIILGSLGVRAAETIEGRDLVMAAGGYAVPAGTLRHAVQEERARGVTRGCTVSVRPGGPGESSVTRVKAAAGGAGA